MISNQRPGADAGRRVRFAFSRVWPRAAHADNNNLPIGLQGHIEIGRAHV